MNKFIIVGHPESGYQEVESILLQSGMTPPKHSNREGLTPIKIDNVLCNAYQCPSPTEISSKNDVNQINVEPIWQGMALDLMLANVDQYHWGWSDPNAIYLLDYWKNVDSSIKFIFVYNDPTKVLTNHVNSKSPNANIDNWCAFNAAILHFHYRNQERSVLIHTRQAKESVNTYLEQLKSQQPDAAVNEFPTKQKTTSNLDTSETKTTQLTEALDFTDEPGPLDRLLAQLFLNQQPAADQLYEELQSASILPLEHAEADATSVHFALNDLLAQKAERDYLKQENDLLLTQLHQLQEELERFHFGNTPPYSNLTTENTVRIGAAKRVQHQLSYRLGATIIEHSRSFIGLVTMLWAIVNTVRTYKKEHRILLTKKLPPISEYADAYEAERVKKHLSYKLGQAILTNARSPLRWLRIPFAIRHEVRDFQLKRSHK